MKNITLKWFRTPGNGPAETGLLFIVLLLLWPIVQRIMISQDPTSGYIDPGIWLLILLAVICFLLLVGISFWLLQRFWMALSLPPVDTMVLQFKSMQLWQQLGFWWASFVALLLAAVGCLSAIC